MPIKVESDQYLLISQCVTFINPNPENTKQTLAIDEDSHFFQLLLRPDLNHRPM